MKKLIRNEVARWLSAPLLREVFHTHVSSILPSFSQDASRWLLLRRLCNVVNYIVFFIQKYERKVNYFPCLAMIVSLLSSCRIWHLYNFYQTNKFGCLISCYTFLFYAKIRKKTSQEYFTSSFFLSLYVVIWWVIFDKHLVVVLHQTDHGDILF